MTGGRQRDVYLYPLSKSINGGNLHYVRTARQLMTGSFFMGLWFEEGPLPIAVGDGEEGALREGPVDA